MTTTKTTRYTAQLDGEHFAMSSRSAAIAACEANATGGTLIAPDGSRTRIAPKTQTVLRYQATGNLDDGGLT